MKTRLILSAILGLLVAVSSVSCNASTVTTVQPDNPVLSTPTHRPPVITRTLASPPHNTPVAPVNSPVATQRPTRNPRPTLTLAVTQSDPGGPVGQEALGFFDATFAGLGVVNYAFITDYGRDFVFMSWINTNPTVYIDAPFTSPIPYLFGNNITTRSDNTVLLADYSPHENGNVTIWQVNTQGNASIVKAISEPALIVITLEFSPDGSLLAVGYNNGEIRLFNTTNGSLTRFIQAHNDEVTSLAFSYDGRYLVSDSWSFDPFTYVFDATSGSKVATLSTASYEPGMVSFSPDGALVAATSSDGTHIFSTSNWSETGGFVPGIWEGKFTCDGRLLMVSLGEDLTEFYSLTTGLKVSSVEAGPLYCFTSGELMSLEIDTARNGVEYISYTP